MRATTQPDGKMMGRANRTAENAEDRRERQKKPLSHSFSALSASSAVNFPNTSCSRTEQPDVSAANPPIAKKKWQKSKSAGQIPARRLQRVAAQLVARKALFARQGTVVESWRTVRGKRFGPYYRVSFREHGRAASIYLGRSAELAEAIRAKLRELQHPLREDRQWRKDRAQAMAELRQQKKPLAPGASGLGPHPARL